MSPLSIRCIKSAFLYLACGLGLGVTFALDRAVGALLRPMHAEFNLWGWATLLIYGMAYHMLPRFSGRALRWPRLADAQSWLAIAGVAIAALGWAALVMGVSNAWILGASGGLLQALAALLFAIQIGSILFPKT